MVKGSLSPCREARSPATEEPDADPTKEGSEPATSCASVPAKVDDDAPQDEKPLRVGSTVFRQSFEAALEAAMADPVGMLQLIDAAMTGPVKEKWVFPDPLKSPKRFEKFLEGEPGKGYCLKTSRDLEVR